MNQKNGFASITNSNYMDWLYACH